MHIEHIAMYVNDLEAVKDFFAQYFQAMPNTGYHNPVTGFRSYFLSFEDGARLELMKRSGIEDDQKRTFRTGYAHIAFSLGSRSAVDALTKKTEA